MHITKKFDRAFQWAGEKMGQEAKTGLSEEFKMLETEMALRHDGMDRLQRSMNVYTKSLSRRCEAAEDKEKGLPISFLGRTMISHGEDFEPDSDFGNCLVAMGQGNERIAGIQETYVAHASSYWLEGCERNLAMMKEYQAARKKLENRRLAYDASTTKMQKAKREDFRLEDELRTSKAKYEESSEDVFRRMQDIKEAEADAMQDLTNFLDAELEYHERCAEELRRVRAAWPVTSTGQLSSSRGGQSEYGLSRRTSRPRSNTAQSFGERNDRTERWATRQDIYEEEEPAPAPVRMPIRSARQTSSGTATPVSPPRPGFNRSMTHQGTFEGPRDRSTYREPPLPPPSQETLRKSPAVPTNVGSLRGNLRPINRIHTSQSAAPDVFADDYDTNTSSGSPDYDRSESPATSYGSLSRTTSNTGLAAKKAPPPPPPSRAKKPAPPIPQKREMAY
ncbi:putative BAR domain-containing protein [Seiridium cardinale]